MPEVRIHIGQFLDCDVTAMVRDDPDTIHDIKELLRQWGGMIQLNDDPVPLGGAADHLGLVSVNKPRRALDFIEPVVLQWEP